MKIKNLINCKKTELDNLNKIYKLYPNVSINYSPNGIIFTDSSLNKKVDTLETIVPGIKFGFYYKFNDVKIYSDPCNVVVSNGYTEINWLGNCSEINPKLIISLMKKIKSFYLHDFIYQSFRFPSLIKWIAQYDPENEVLKSNKNLPAVITAKNQLKNKY